MVDALVMDVRHSMRRLGRSPGVSFIIVATLALVIGANTTVFSLLNATILRDVGAVDPDRLAAISVTNAQTNGPGFIYTDTFESFRAEQRSFSLLSLYHGTGFYRVEANGHAFDAGFEAVMPEYLSLAGARLAMGRFLTTTDNSVAGSTAPAVVITDRFWQRAFARDPRALGATIKVDAKPMTIVGVTEAGFHGLQADSGAYMFLPLALSTANGGGDKRPLRGMNIVGRLRADVTLTEARAEVLARWPSLIAATVSALPAAEQNTARSQRVDVQTLEAGFSTIRREYGTAVIMLVALAAVLLSIACVNVVGLMLGRALGRQNETAVRLAMSGLAAALPLAWWACEQLTDMLTVGRPIPLLTPLTPDGRVLAVATAATTVTALLIGLIPAWRSARGTAIGTFQSRTVAHSLGRSGRAILATQVVLSMMLAVCAGLFAGTLANLQDNEGELGSHSVVFTRLTRNPGERATVLAQPFFQGLLEELSRIPGVDRAAYSSMFPGALRLASALPMDSYTLTRSPDGSARVQGLTELVSPGFFDLFGIAHMQGRDFTWSDNKDSPAVAILNSSLAAALFPSGDAIGRSARISSGTTHTDVVVVGIVADAPMGRLRDPHQPALFRPMMQDLARAQTPMPHVRVVGDIAAVRDAYTKVVESRGHHYVRGLLTLEELIDSAVVRERLIAGFSGAAATLAVGLACLGIYGALAYAVTSRIREIGVRMSLGATRAAIVQMIVRDGLGVVVIGCLIGVPCALGAATLVRSQLYGVTPTDPLTIVLVVTTFLVTGGIAALSPAWRASRIEPLHALRQE